MPNQSSPAQNSLHAAALAWADAGFSIFPCLPGAKEPAVAGGYKAATTDAAKINAWWNENPSYNIACAPEHSGHVVLDADPPLGLETIAKLEVEHGHLPLTFTVRTPRGGIHLWFEGRAASSAQRLGPKLDTRGVGGYVLVPPSRIGVGVYANNPNGGSYENQNDQDIAEAPAWIGVALAVTKERHEAASEEKDTEVATGRARTLLQSCCERGDVAREGAGGDDRTYRLCAEILNLGLSVERAADLIGEIWNPHCEPPWDEDELLAKVENAAAYAQNEAGAWAVESPAETFFERARALVVEVRDVGRSKFYPRDMSEQRLRPPPAWLIDGLLPAEGTVLLYGPSNSSKSFLALDIALSIAAGRAAFRAESISQGPVVYIAAEGARGLERLRVPAWQIAHDHPNDLPLYTVDTIPLVIRPDDVLESIEAIKERGVTPRLVVLDTLARGMAGMNENDAKDAGVFIEAIETMKRALGCTVLVVHHSGKESERGARGSSAFLAGFDTVIEVTANTDTKAVSMHVKKQKDADAADAPWLFEGRKAGPSLAFHAVGATEYRVLTEAENMTGRRQVGAALMKLGAIGPEKAVTTAVLAVALAPASEDAAAQEALVSRLGRTLRHGAKEYLRDYCEGTGLAIRWSLPIP